MYQQADTSYPAQSGGLITCCSTFASGSANFARNEWCFADGSGAIPAGATLADVTTGVVLINHKVVSLGIKSSGTVWTAQDQRGLTAMVEYDPPLISSIGFTFGNGSGTPDFTSGIASMGSNTSDGWYPALYSSPVASDGWYVQCTVAIAPTSVPGGIIIPGNSSYSQQVAIG